jgi:hypothetical protein
MQCWIATAETDLLIRWAGDGVHRAELLHLAVEEIEGDLGISQTESLSHIRALRRPDLNSGARGYEFIRCYFN